MYSVTSHLLHTVHQPGLTGCEIKTFLLEQISTSAPVIPKYTCLLATGEGDSSGRSERMLKVIFGGYIFLITAFSKVRALLML